MLDVFLKRKDKSASISFLHADDARAFYEHVRKHDLYIKQRRVRNTVFAGFLIAVTDIELR